MNDDTPHALTVWRKANGHTLAAFGDLIGAKKSMVKKWEDGVIPRKEYIAKIQEITDCAVTAQDWYAPLKVAS